MAKDLSTATRIGTDPDFLNGDLIDETGSNNGTLLDTTILQDIAQFFQKLLNLAGITPNGNFDNEVNGYQLVQALDDRHNVPEAKVFTITFYAAALAAGATETKTFFNGGTFVDYRAIGRIFSTTTGAINADANSSGVPPLDIFDDANLNVSLTATELSVTNKSGGSQEIKIALQIFAA